MSGQFVPELELGCVRGAQGQVTLLAPSPGLWRDAPAAGALLRPGDLAGSLEILGVLHHLRVPAGAVGVVSSELPERCRAPVGFGDALLTLDPEALGGALVSESLATEADAEGELVLRAPSSGRFYRRPAPDKPNFVEVGQIVSRGQAVGLLEVMKTFTRVHYDDPKLPERAKVVAIPPADQDEVGSGDPILVLEPVES
jgi:acetyl-CoA carboxylase biotin carboxyl carrier protein